MCVCVPFLRFLTLHLTWLLACLSAWPQLQLTFDWVHSSTLLPTPSPNSGPPIFVGPHFLAKLCGSTRAFFARDFCFLACLLLGILARKKRVETLELLANCSYVTYIRLSACRQFPLLLPFSHFLPPSLTFLLPFLLPLLRFWGVASFSLYLLTLRFLCQHLSFYQSLTIACLGFFFTCLSLSLSLFSLHFSICACFISARTHAVGTHRWALFHYFYLVLLVSCGQF